MAYTSKERLERWKQKRAARALLESADNARFDIRKSGISAARMGETLAKPRDRHVTEKRLAGVLAARRRRKRFEELVGDADQDGKHDHGGTDG